MADAAPSGEQRCCSATLAKRLQELCTPIYCRIVIIIVMVIAAGIAAVAPPPGRKWCQQHRWAKVTLCIFFQLVFQMLLHSQKLETTSSIASRDSTDYFRRRRNQSAELRGEEQTAATSQKMQRNIQRKVEQTQETAAVSICFHRLDSSSILQESQLAVSSFLLTILHSAHRAETVPG